MLEDESKYRCWGSAHEIRIHSFFVSLPLRIPSESGFVYVPNRTFWATIARARASVLETSLYGYPFGGGIYQRMLPFAAATRAVGQLRTRCPHYHSYDVGATLPGSENTGSNSARISLSIAHQSTREKSPHKKREKKRHKTPNTLFYCSVSPPLFSESVGGAMERGLWPVPPREF